MAGVEPGMQLVSLQGSCASLSVTGTTTLRVTATPAETMPLVGDAPGSVEQAQACPSDQMIVAFAGRSGSDIDQLAMVCAPLLIGGSYPNYQLSLGELAVQPGIGNLGGAPFDQISCPVGQVAVGHEGRAATIVNTLGLLCAAPALVL